MSSTWALVIEGDAREYDLTLEQREYIAELIVNGFGSGPLGDES